MTLYYQLQYKCRVEDTKFAITLAEDGEFYKKTPFHEILVEPLFITPSTNIKLHYAHSKIC
jgi:hypothetical protein